MEKSLTRAARVARKLKAGRPRLVPTEPMEPYEAIHRIVEEANRARALMKQAGLDANDIRTGLVYVTPDVPDMKNFWQCEWLPKLDESKPTLEQTKPFFDRFLKLALNTTLIAVGLIWRHVDREASPGEWRITLWLTSFIGGPKYERALLAAKAHYEREIKAGKALDN